MATAQSDFDVLLVLFGVWGVDFGIFGPRELVEQVRWLWLRFIQRGLHVAVELLREWVAVVNMEYSVVEIDVYPHV